MPDVFVSYNREDREVARAVATALEAEGFSVWWDAVLRAGEYYEEVTEKNLRSAAAVVVLWSKRSVESKWVRAEATVGERSSILVPALIEECDRPVRFELVQTADLTRWSGDRNDANWRAFVLDVRAAVNRGGRTGRPAPSAGAQPAMAAPAASASDASVTIETTFWNSIKDGSERADFEAYLARYPRGHFVELARNRLNALGRAAATPARPVTSAEPSQQRVAQTSSSRAAPAQSSKPASRPAAPEARPVAPPARGSGQAEAQGSGLNGPLILAGVAAALVAAGVAAFLLMRGGAPAEPAALSAKIETPQLPAAEVIAGPPTLEGQPPPIETSAEPPSEAATGDVFADATSAQPSVPLVELAEPEVEPAAADPAPSAALSSSAAPAPAARQPIAPVVKAGAARDCDVCPLMATLPGGRFQMGSPEDEPGRNAYEGPQHEVTIKPFRMAVFEVTAEEWRACVADGACEAKRDLGDGRYPALGVSWREATGYARWLSRKTGKTYRLPSEAEWEYAARAGAATAWSWGDRFDRSKLVRDGVKAVGAFPANAFGLHDMESNAREWVEDCYVNNFTETPRDGSPARNGDCSMRVIRGGYWGSPNADTRIANRSRINQTGQPQYMGVRVAADIN